MTVIEQEQTTTRSGAVDDWLATLNVETGLYILIGLVALALRFVHLGEASLSASEAREALAVWRFVPRSVSDIAPVQPVSAAWYTLG